MTSDRSVSPVGASRFEQPFVPPSRLGSTKSVPSSPVFARSASVMHPLATTSSSLDSGYHTHKDKEVDDLTPSTPAGSIPPADADEWFAQFRSDPELSTGVSDLCPDRATLASVYDIPIFGQDGKSMPFGSIYDPAYALHQRQLVIFVRHFYCGACQAYLQAISKSITKEDYFAIPTPTSIIVIGCGQPDLIHQYKKFTGCPFPIYADPTRQLFKKLGMIVTLNMGGERPEYMKDISIPNWASGQFKTIKNSLKEEDGIRKRDILRGGHPLQIGGEFLFDQGEVVWCHRMGNMRNHTEVKQIRKLLELEEEQ